MNSKNNFENQRIALTKCLKISLLTMAITVSLSTTPGKILSLSILLGPLSSLSIILGLLLNLSLTLGRLLRSSITLDPLSILGITLDLPLTLTLEMTKIVHFVLSAEPTLIVTPSVCKHTKMKQ